MSTWTFPRSDIVYSRRGQRIKFTGPSRFEASSAQIADTIEPKFRFKMSGRRRRNFKRAYPRRRRALSGGRNAGRIALRKISQLEKKIEVKELTAVNQTLTVAIGGAGGVNGFGPYMSQGTADGTRVGEKITVRSLSIHLNVALGALEADGTSLRILIIIDRDPAGADCAFTDVLVSDDLLSSYNREGANRGRFQILTDKTVSFDAQQGKWNGRFFKKLNIPVRYSGNAGTVADVTKNHFLMLACARDNAAAITLDWGMRFMYTDE